MTGDVTPTGQSKIAGHPKLDGNRVTLRNRVYPDHYRRATLRAAERGLSISEYLMELIDRDTGREPASSGQGVLDVAV